MEIEKNLKTVSSFGEGWCRVKRVSFAIENILSPEFGLETSTKELERRRYEMMNRISGMDSEPERVSPNCTLVHRETASLSRDREEEVSPSRKTISPQEVSPSRKAISLQEVSPSHEAISLQEVSPSRDHNSRVSPSRDPISRVSPSRDHNSRVSPSRDHISRVSPSRKYFHREERSPSRTRVHPREEHRRRQIASPGTTERGTGINSSLSPSKFSNLSPDETSGLPAWIFCTRYSDRPSSGPRSKRNRHGEAGVRRHLSSQSTRSPVEDKRIRTSFSVDQLDRLQAEFESNPYLTEDRRSSLALQLNLTEAQIKIWFQNKRAKCKKTVGGFRTPFAYDASHESRMAAVRISLSYSPAGLQRAISRS